MLYAFPFGKFRAPGCIPDWASESHLIVTNCYFDPNIFECLQASVQISLAACGIVTAIFILSCPYNRDNLDEKEDRRSVKSNTDSYKNVRTVPAFLSLSRSGAGGHSLSRHGRSSNRGHSGIPKSTPLGNVNHSSSNGDALSHIAIDERLRPMTPRKVKRRSARSIQSTRYGANPTAAGTQSYFVENSGAGSSKSHASGGGSGSNRNSLRSNQSSRRSSNHRSSKRKPANNPSQFVSPLNRIMQQQIDSETSHDEPRYYKRDQVISAFLTLI